MSSYTILPRRQMIGFKVEIVGDDGTRNTILGFDDAAGAASWVEANERHERAFRSPLMTDTEGFG